MKFTQSYLHNTRQTVQQYGFVHEIIFLYTWIGPWTIYLRVKPVRVEIAFSSFLPSFLLFFYRLLKLDRNRLSTIVIYTRGDLESNLLSEELEDRKESVDLESSSWIFFETIWT